MKAATDVDHWQPTVPVALGHIDDIKRIMGCGGVSLPRAVAPLSQTVPRSCSQTVPVVSCFSLNFGTPSARVDQTVPSGCRVTLRADEYVQYTATFGFCYTHLM